MQISIQRRGSVKRPVGREIWSRTDESDERFSSGFGKALLIGFVVMVAIQIIKAVISLI